jgi:DNA-binding response OmpR family regulator
MKEKVILWADDEMDLLKPHIIFLSVKGYNVKTFTNGSDLLDAFKEDDCDLIFLDENMPGLNGLETLTEIKKMNPNIPVVMITKSEEEYLMEDAIGSQIADYLIKPVKPTQILMTIKKLIENKRLVSEKTSSAYQQDFRHLLMSLNADLTYTEWIDIYKKLVSWELKLQDLEDPGMLEILTQQKHEANTQFSKFIERNYINWLKSPEDAPIMSHQLLKKKLFPLLDEIPTFLLVIDNLRYDQWKVISPVLMEYFRLESEDMFYSILPTATQYSRNAIFSGLMPSEMEKQYPKLWKNDDDEGGKNLHEEEFLVEQLKRSKINIKHSYHKITSHEQGKNLVENVSNLMNNQLNVIVYNFVDMLSHVRTEMEVIKELSADEKAYRSITLSWFENSPLLEIFKKIANKKVRLVVTTDHGTIRVKTPSKVVGDRNTNMNLRYKQGKNLAFSNKEVFFIKNPKDAMLPQINLSQHFIFAKDERFFVYANNYNHFVNMFNDTFQHGGISLEEVIIPFAVLQSKH